MKQIVVGLVMLVACGDNQAGVRITLPGTPSFVMYEEAGVWKHPLVITSNDGPPSYELSATGPYRFVWVCAISGEGLNDGFYLDELFADYAEGDQVVQLGESVVPYSCYNPPGVRRLATAIGHVVQAGEVAVGGEVNASSDPDWLFTLIAPPGPHDVVFTPFTSNTIVVRRDVPFAEIPVAQPTIDLTTEGLARAPLTVTLPSNVPALFMWSSTTYLDDHGYRSRLTSANAAAYVFPLDADLSQIVELEIDGSNAVQRAAFDTAGPRPALLPPVPDVSFPTSSQVTWQHEALDATRFDFTVARNTASNSTSNGAFHAAMTPLGRAAFGATLDLAVDRNAPGFLDAWRVMPDASLRTLSVISGGDDGVRYTTTVDAPYLDAR